MSNTSIKTLKRARRQKRIRSQISGTSEVPRLAVFRSNRVVYAQLIDDTAGKTLAAASSMKIAGKGILAKSKEVGKSIAEQAKAKKISKIVFDRAGYIYTGKIKALAEGAREGGLKF